jgi:hypothetical protein
MGATRAGRAPSTAEKNAKLQNEPEEEQALYIQPYIEQTQPSVVPRESAYSTVRKWDWDCFA